NSPSDTVPLYEAYSSSLALNSSKSIDIEASPSSTVIDKCSSSKVYSPVYVLPLSENVTSFDDSKSNTGVFEENLNSAASASSLETVGLYIDNPSVLPRSEEHTSELQS